MKQGGVTTLSLVPAWIESVPLAGEAGAKEAGRKPSRQELELPPGRRMFTASNRPRPGFPAHAAHGRFIGHSGRKRKEEMSAVHLRLARVTIENLPWQEFVGRYDRAKTFFYLDPPYYMAPYYEHNLELKDYQEMAKILAGVGSKFILSINDTPEMRKAFKCFNVKHVSLKYTVSKKGTTQGKELLIRNF